MAFSQEKAPPWTSVQNNGLRGVPEENMLGEMDGTSTDAEDMDNLGKKQELNVCLNESDIGHKIADEWSE